MSKIVRKPPNFMNTKNEISQTTYIELISAREEKAFATSGPNPSVEASLNSLAFKKRQKNIRRTRRDISIANPITETGSITRYNITSSKSNIVGNSSEFRSLLSNPVPVIKCNKTFDITGPVKCNLPPTDCMIDFAVVLDDTGSMSGAINNLKSGIDTISGYFETISGGNYRMALMTFKDCLDAKGNSLIKARVRFPTDDKCGNAAEFKAALSTVVAEGGGGTPEASDVALQHAVEGTMLGTWRADPNVIKVILLVTDASVAGCNDVRDAEDVQRLYDSAAAARECGIKVIFVAASFLDIVPSKEIDQIKTDGKYVAETTNGLYVETTYDGGNLPELVYSFIFSLCSIVSAPECIGDNVILNGKFDKDVAGWGGEGRIWNATGKNLELTPNSYATQTIAGLTPGDKVSVFFDVLGDMSLSSTLLYGIDGETYEALVPQGSGPSRYNFVVTVPISGSITVRFQTDGHVFIDNVNSCVIPSLECGPGTRNSVENPYFINGVENWTDENGADLSPSNDSRWWDEANTALIVGLSGAPVVKQTITGLTPGNPAAFGFLLLSHEPSAIGSLELIYEIRDSTNKVILTETLKNSDISFPYKVYKSITIPSSTITIVFKLGPVSGGARIRDVLLCDILGNCQPGYSKLSYNTFDINLEGWNNGLYSEGRMILPFSNRVTKTYTGLIPGSTFQITVEVISSGSLTIELLSGLANNQYTYPSDPGLYTATCVVQDGGIVNVSLIGRPSTPPPGATIVFGGVTVDNILACQSTSAKCDGSLTNLSSGIEWNGIPRLPINIFNVFARITLRDPTNPYNKNTINLIPNADGHIGTELPTACGTGTTCDFWKQHGNGGVSESSITNQGLTTSSISSINPGDIKSITTRGNWLWSIPANPSGASQDSLISLFPPESVGKVIESIEIFYLANRMVPSSGGFGHVYSANTTAQAIEILTTNGSDDPATVSGGTPIKIRTENVGCVDLIAVDPGKNKLFYTQTTGIVVGAPRGKENSIWSCDLNGTKELLNGLRIVHMGDDALDAGFTETPIGIDVDTKNSYIYYAVNNNPDGPNKILRCNYDGSDKQVILTIAVPALYRLRVRDNYIYFVTLDDIVSGKGSVRRCNLDGSNLITININVGYVPLSIEVTATKLYVGAYGKIIRMNLDGSDAEEIITGVLIPADIIIFEPFLYISDAGYEVIVSADLDGNYKRNLTSDNQNRQGMAINRVSTSGGLPNPTCTGTFNCSPDPADSFDIVIKYKNSVGLNKEFHTTIQQSSLYEQKADFLAGEPWDKVATIGTGLRGNTARWESVKFNIDTTKGDGLDQCTTPTGFVATGSGSLKFSEFRFLSTGSFFDPCDSEVIITEIAKGNGKNEKQSVKLPGPSGGTWTITTDINDDIKTTPAIPWNVTAGELKTILESLSNIGIGNIFITGKGKPADPFIIEFVNDLAGMNIPLITADGSNLLGTASGVVETVANGTKNERQTILVAPGTLNNLTAKFGTITSIPIGYNWSLNQKQAALCGISTIGPNGVYVTGGTTDRDMAYTGDMTIDFVGPLAGSNVPQIEVQPSISYSAYTNWNGGTGINEEQKIKILANSGTFKIKIYNPNDDTMFYTTSSIPYNATSDQIKLEIVASGYYNDTDLIVTQPDPIATEWIIEFAGTYANIDIKQIEVDSSGLYGGGIIITGMADGEAVLEKQRITIKRATAGYFKLDITIDGLKFKSDKIAWDTTAFGLKQILEQHPKININDVIVVQEDNGLDPDVVSIFTVTFKAKFGDVAIMVADYEKTLLCNPVILPHVPPPPYGYSPESECEIEDLSCQTGPLFTKPCPGEEPLPSELCCTNLNIRDSANISTTILIQRDLLDPNTKTTPGSGSARKFTIRDAVIVKGLDPSDYVPYLRNFSTGELSETNYSKIAESGLSVVLIENSLNANGGKSKVSRHLSSHREILPTRMIWPSNSTSSN